MSNEDGLDVAVHEECFEMQRGLALVDSVCPNFGTAIFNWAGKKGKFFFLKNRVFVDGKKVSKKTLLTDILKCDMVVVFEAEPYSSEQYDVTFRATKVTVSYADVLEDKLPSAFVNCSNTRVDNLLLKSGFTDIASMQALKNHCASVKHVSNVGGVLDCTVLDCTSEVTFHWSVVLIPEYFEGKKSLPNLIPTGTKVNFDAVVTNSGIKATSLWVGVKPNNISFKKWDGATDSDGLMKDWSGIVESYYSANEGTIGGFKIKGQKMVAVFHRKNVYFTKPTKMALQDYLPVGALVHFDGKLVTSENWTFVKVFLLWCQKRSTITMEEALCEQPQSRHSLDSVSSVEVSAASVCTSGTGTSDAPALSISRNGRVIRYVSVDTGIINCSVFGKESEVLFHRSDVCFPSKKASKKILADYLPVGSPVCFTAEMFTFSGQILVKSLNLIQEHANSALPSVANERSAIASPVPNSCSSESVNENSYVAEVSKSSQNTKEILVGRCGNIKYYNSPSKGVIECTINDLKQNILFSKGSLLLEPQLYAKKLIEAFPVGTVVNFDAKKEMLGDCCQYVATAMWVKKKPKPSTSAPMATAPSYSSIVSGTNTKEFLHNRAAQIRGFISDVGGIVEFSFNGTIKRTFFHRDVVYLPNDVTVPLQDYLTVGRNVFFDGWFEERSSDRIIVTSLWAEKKKKVQSPNNAVDVQAEDSKLDQEFSDSRTSCQVSDCAEYSSEDSNTERHVNEDAAASGGWEIPGPVSSSVRGLTAKVLSYTSKHSGIIQCTIFKNNRTATFHRSVVRIPDKAKDLTLEEYLPVGMSVHLDGEVTMDEHAECVQPTLTVTLLWSGKKPKPHVSESPVKLTISSDKLSQSEVYEAAVVEVDKFCFTASISRDGSKIPVLVWNQYFRPSVMCEEPLKKGELVSLHVCIGDKVFLQVQRYDGKGKDKFEWCAYDAWKDSRVTLKERASVCSRNDRVDDEGTVMWLDEEFAFLRAGVSGMDVTFQRRNALLFGISLAEFDLSKIFRIGDSLSYVLDNDVEASKVWFGSCSIEGTTSGFLKIKEFCLDRCIPSDVTLALVKQLARQISKGGANSRTSQGMGEDLPVAVSDNQKFAEENEYTDEDSEYIYVSSSASTADDSDSDNMTSNEDGPSTMVDLPLTKHNLSPMVVDPLPTRDRPTSSRAMGVQPIEDELVSPLVMAVHPTKDRHTPCAEELQLTEDKQTIPMVMDSLSTKDSSTHSLAVDLQPIEDKLMSPVAIQPTKDIPITVTDELHVAIQPTKYIPITVTDELHVAIQPTKDIPITVTDELHVAIQPTKDIPIPVTDELHVAIQPFKDIPIPVTDELHVAIQPTKDIPIPVTDELHVAIQPTKDIPIPVTDELHVAEVEQTSPVVMDLQPTEDKPSMHSTKTEPTDDPAMDFHVANTTVAKHYSQCSEIYGSYSVSGGSSSCAEADDNDSCTAESHSTVNKSVFPVLQTSLEAVLKSKGFEVQLSNHLISEVMLLVRQGMGLNRDVPRSELPNWGELASGSGNGSEVRQSEQDREVHSVESSTQTTSTGHVISLRYLPYV